MALALNLDCRLIHVMPLRMAVTLSSSTTRDAMMRLVFFSLGCVHGVREWCGWMEFFTVTGLPAIDMFLPAKIRFAGYDDGCAAA